MSAFSQTIGSALCSVHINWWSQCQIDCSSMQKRSLPYALPGPGRILSSTNLKSQYLLRISHPFSKGLKYTDSILIRAFLRALYLRLEEQSLFLWLNYTFCWVSVQCAGSTASMSHDLDLHLSTSYFLIEKKVNSSQSVSHPYFMSP